MERATHNTTQLSVSEAQLRIQRYRAAATLIEEWLNDESGHDERIWPLLEEALKTTGRGTRGAC
jgi:hypothetical protein